MISLYERAHEIKKATGWSQERIGAETGLGLSTISRVFRVPGYVGNETSKRLLTQLHEEVVRTPFPQWMDKLFNQYDLWREKHSKKELADMQDILEPMLLGQKVLETQMLAACRSCWFLGHLYYDRAFYLRRNGQQAASTALEYYQQALTRLEQYPDAGLLVQKYKLRQCIVSTTFNRQPAGTRHENPEIRRWLRDLNYLDVALAVVREEPWNWIAARNGLVAASVLSDLAACHLFWEAMQQAYPQFKNLDFVPTQAQPSIAHDPDLSWFVAHLR